MCRILDAYRILTGARVGCLAILAPSEEGPVLVWSGGSNPAEPCVATARAPSAALAAVLAEGRTRYENAPRQQDWGDFFRGLPVLPANVLVAPLKLDEKSLGFVVLGEKPRPFDAGDIRACESLASSAADACRRARRDLSAVRRLGLVQLEDERDRLTAILDCIDLLVYVTDMTTAEILFVNTYARRVFGNVIGKRCWEALQEGQTGPCAFCTNDRLLDASGAPAGTVVWEFQNTRTHRWYECRDQAIRWVDGRLVRMEVAADITERKRLAELIVAAQREASIATLAGGVAHDFNNILTAVEGYSELLLEKLKDAPELRRLRSARPLRGFVAGSRTRCQWIWIC
ncbi:MAG: GAF domain-containing protein [Candidatus Schekmanbacteria bacterium]|nr:GAF domain-containing protein [Candidatus Schekmanbacteria bacterium]